MFVLGVHDLTTVTAKRDLDVPKQTIPWCSLITCCCHICSSPGIQPVAVDPSFTIDTRLLDG